VVGHVVLQWYLTGRQITKQQMRAMYSQALANGKKIAQGMLARLPRPRLGWRKKTLPPSLITKSCPFCLKPNAPDANFCQYCGQSFQPTLSSS
jgi:hypothetical protein